MPEICRFFGISIKMYFGDHLPPHFHAVPPFKDSALRTAGVLYWRHRIPARAFEPDREV
jgi:hypothetical protein